MLMGLAIFSGIVLIICALCWLAEITNEDKELNNKLRDQQHEKQQESYSTQLANKEEKD